MCKTEQNTLLDMNIGMLSFVLSSFGQYHHCNYHFNIVATADVVVAVVVFLFDLLLLLLLLRLVLLVLLLSVRFIL